MTVPKYYKVNPKVVYDIIDVVSAMGDMHGFCRGNILKYLYRAGEKGNKMDDLLKARDYLNRLINHVEKEETDNK